MDEINQLREENQRLRNRLREAQVEIAGKNAVIDALHGDLDYYRKEWKDQMIQDQGQEPA